MADKTSYVRIDRNIIRWRWWFDHNTLVTFLYLLIEANIKENGFEGQTIRRGQLVTSLPSLCKSTGLTNQQVRTAIKHLKSTGEITVKAFSRFSVITIVNYDKYQDLTGKITYKQQSANSLSTGKQQHLEKGEKGEKERRREGGRSAPSSHSGDPPRGSAEWKAISHKRLRRDEGTVDDIPDEHRKAGWDDFGKYWDWRNQ